MKPNHNTFPRGPGSPKLRMVSWNLNTECVSEVMKMKDTPCSFFGNMTAWRGFLMKKKQSRGTVKMCFTLRPAWTWPWVFQESRRRDSLGGCADEQHVCVCGVFSFGRRCWTIGFFISSIFFLARKKSFSVMRAYVFKWKAKTKPTKIWYGQICQSWFLSNQFPF